jgi:cob(I)alamin adenosyltransferase
LHDAYAAVQSACCTFKPQWTELKSLKYLNRLSDYLYWKLSQDLSAEG